MTDNPEYTGLVATVSFSMKVNLGGYESADCFISVSNIDLDTTAYEVDELLNGPAQIVYDLIKARVQSRANALKERPSAQNAVQAPESKSGPPGPRPRPKVVRAPRGRLDALTRIEAALLRQLAAAGVVDARATQDDPEGSLIREAIRVNLVGDGPWDPKSEEDYQLYVQALSRMRDQNIKQPEVLV